MRRHEVTDEQWLVIQPLLPEGKGHTGRPPRPPRRMLNGILWILRTGAPWRDLPEGYGPWRTVYGYFRSWRDAGVFERVLEAMQIRLDAEGGIDWDLWCVDGTTIRASRAAAGAGKRGALKNPQTTLWAAREADSARNCTWLLTAEACRWPPTSRRGRSTSPRNSSRS